MYQGRKRDFAQTEAAAAQRRRQDAAPPLRDQAPDLETLRLSFDERRPDGATPAMPYARPIVVASARAHFEFRCMEPRCDGRHDLTAVILKALRERRASTVAEQACNGVIDNTACDRTLIVTCEATYRS
ncbi:MAG TPA: hypothetical protein VJV78_24215 [Polyangiales bacterium]|nr:hypothetical protein [Polyangiales bacterium]